MYAERRPATADYAIKLPPSGEEVCLACQHTSMVQVSERASERASERQGVASTRVGWGLRDAVGVARSADGARVLSFSGLTIATMTMVEPSLACCVVAADSIASAVDGESGRGVGEMSPLEVRRATLTCERSRAVSFDRVRLGHAFSLLLLFSLRMIDLAFPGNVC